MSIRLRRLQAEYDRMRRMFAHHERIRIVEAIGDPPDCYIIEYRVRGLVEEKGGIRERDLHRAQITLGPYYPKDKPLCTMLTPVFHPNIDPSIICTEDLGAAGQTLDQIVVFIGRMITFQAHNVQSPRNGDAARWLLENLDKIPLERVDLEPPALSLPNPKEESSDIIVQTCANCGRRDSSAAVGRCTGDHLVCTDCTLACATCLRTICVLCDLPSCAVCGQQVCAECLSACQRCGCGLCREHRVSCQACGAVYCSGCASACGGCTRRFCQSHLNRASRCPNCGPLGDGTSTSTLAGSPSHIVITVEEVRSVPESALIPPFLKVHLVPKGAPRSTGKAVTSLIFGVLGLPVMGILVGWFAILFASMALREIDRNDVPGRKLAISGLVLGIIDIVLWVVVFAFFADSTAAAFDGPSPLPAHWFTRV